LRLLAFRDTATNLNRKIRGAEAAEVSHALFSKLLNFSTKADFCVEQQ
jgi:hypothetical protein